LFHLLQHLVEYILLLSQAHLRMRKLFQKKIYLQQFLFLPQFAKETINASKGLDKQADSAQKLLEAYNKLSQEEAQVASSGKNSSALRVERNRVVAQLQKLLGDSVVSINKETGAISLNNAATKEAIKDKRLEVELNKVRLTQLVQSYNEAIPQIEAAVLKVQQSFAKSQLSLGGLSLTDERRQELLEAVKEQNNIRKLLGAGEAQSTQTFNGAQIKAAEEYLKAEANLATQEAALQQAQKDRAKVQAALNALSKLGADTAKAKTVVLEDEIETEKKKKQSVADLAAEEFKLRKQRLEARIAELDRQAENPANTEQLRNEALQKAAQQRLVLAGLERQEGGRVAAESNKDKIGGDKATALVRLQLSEKFATDSLAINRKLGKDEVALRTLVLDQLAAVDKLALDTELAALDKMSEDENRSYAERQAAALNASARRIELILIESDIKRRAAKGDAQELLRIQREQDKQTTDILRNSKPFDSAKFLDELRKGYAVQGLALEEQRGKGLVTERQYDQQVRSLENSREKDSMDALEREYGLTADVLERRRALRQRINEQELEDDKRTAELRGQLLTEGLQFAQDLLGSYFEFRAHKNQAEIENEEASTAAGIKALGDNEEAKRKLQEESDARLRKLKVEQAKRDRDQALATIAINTAIAVTSVLSTGGGTRFADFGISAGILSALVIASGLAQAAAVLAQPLPTYFKGREGGPAEWAVVGERGPELIQGRSGGARLVEKPSITYLEQGDSVLTAQRTQEFLRAAASGLPQAPAFGDSMQVVNQQFTAPAPAVTVPLDKALRTQTGELSRVLERLPEQTATALIRKRMLLNEGRLEGLVLDRLRRMGR
jgi:hypothetical protein